MKQRRIIPINLIILVIIMCAMVFIGVQTQGTIDALTLKDIKNVTRLTQTNIHAEITKELAEPVNTSLIMAQNTFIFEFMNQDTLDTELRMAEYLSAVQEVTGYDSVFLVPHKTLSYYHPGGTDAKVDLESDASFWYKKRIDQDDAYGIVVNTEQLDDFAMTAYVDANILDSKGEFAGLTGVGLRLTHLQDILANYMSNQQVEAYVVDSEGLVQIHNDEDLIRSQNFYELEGLAEDTFAFTTEMIRPVEKQVGDKFVIVQYMPLYKWYLVVTKSTSELTPTLNQYSANMYFMLSVVAIIMMAVTSVTIGRYKQQIIELSNQDHLTEIPNRRIFDKDLKEAIKNAHDQSFSLALFDIDNLKIINDELGHDRGDVALRAVARIARESMPETCIVSRIGGDEFAIIIDRPLEQAMFLLEIFHFDAQEDQVLNDVSATISIGVTEFQKDDTEMSIYRRADQALYQSKETGKNQINHRIVEE